MAQANEVASIILVQLHALVEFETVELAEKAVSNLITYVRP